jgi:hypothetical protein
MWYASSTLPYLLIPQQSPDPAVLVILFNMLCWKTELW